MIQWLKHESRALKGYPMKDPYVREFPVYLPPNYDANRKEPYPVAFILAGWGGKSCAYLADDSAFGVSLPKRLDQAILTNQMPACIVAFPDGSSRLGGSQYLNSPALGYYSDYLCDELCDYIDQSFHTYRDPATRAILGHSSGGFGALINAALRPDRFQFVCSSAGDSYFELSLMPLLRVVVEELERTKSVSAFLEEFLSHPNPMKLSRSKGEAMIMLSMAPCYAPNVASEPLYGDLFFDLRTGEINDEIWQKYLAWDPLHFYPRHEENVRKLKFVLLESGRSDEHALQLGHRRLAKTLKQFEVSHELVEYPGGHSGHTWRFQDRLSQLLKRMPL